MEGVREREECMHEGEKKGGERERARKAIIREHSLCVCVWGGYVTPWFLHLWS